MKTYFGVRNPGGLVVVVCDERGKHKIRWRLDLSNHSPTGLECGYGGSGPAQLALAILADYLADDNRAINLHQDFKWKVIAQLPQDKNWTVTARTIEDAITAIEVERMQR